MFQGLTVTGVSPRQLGRLCCFAVFSVERNKLGLALTAAGAGNTLDRRAGFLGSLPFLLLGTPAQLLVNLFSLFVDRKLHHIFLEFQTMTATYRKGMTSLSKV